MLGKNCLLLVVLGGLLSAASVAVAFESDKEIYGEEALPEHQEDEKDKWREQEWVLPAWPKAEDLVPVDLGLNNFPFEVLLDSKSLSVGKDRVIRYTVVLRSHSGVDNTAFEGVRCNRKEYRRLAYGYNGAFQIIEDSAWKYYSDTGVNRYRAALTREFFCPLNSSHPRHSIVDQLTHQNRLDWLYSGDE